jgi:hypothetical protein
MVELVEFVSFTNKEVDQLSDEDAHNEENRKDHS